MPSKYFYLAKILNYTSSTTPGVFNGFKLAPAVGSCMADAFIVITVAIDYYWRTQG